MSFNKRNNIVTQTRFCVEFVRAKRCPTKKVMPNTDRADRLLCCAVAYRNAEVPSNVIPESFANENDAVSSMMNALWFEARQSMSENISAPEDTYLHPVDIDTDEPGIVASKTKQTDILRRKAPLPRVVYEKAKRERPRVQVDAPCTLAEATAEADARVVKSAKAEQSRARRELRSEQRSLAKLEEKNEKKRLRENETKEERAERLADARAKREERKREKKEESRVSKEEKDPDNDPPPSDDTPSEAAPDSESKNTPSNADVVLHVQELLEMESEADVAHHKLLPSRIRARDKKARFFQSPVPHDRHLCALEQAGLHKSIRDAVLKGKASSALTIIHGPPGTGKTRRLASMLSELPTGRVFACAPTNVGTANLYARLLDYDASSALLMPPSRIPVGTPITSQNPQARVVCSTISGRAGPLLDSESFDTVIIDEAGQCMEAWVWCLLRPEVRRVIMVGDTHQLPALVSSDGEGLKHGRSMMERLLNLGYDAEFLSVQRRMNPEIVAFPNRQFYDGRLATEYAAHVDVPPYQVVDVDGVCEEVGTSFVNRAEIEACLQLSKDLKETFERVVIICPYQAQTRELLAAGAIDVHTVDSFQGQEADAVVLSMVRHGDIGFWNDKRRLNVALTRAKHCLRVVGACSKWTGLLAELTKDARKRNKIVVA